MSHRVIRAYFFFFDGRLNSVENILHFIELCNLCHSSINERSCASNLSKNVAALVHWALTCDLFAFSDINTAEVGEAPSPPSPVAIVTRVNLKDLCCVIRHLLRSRNRLSMIVLSRYCVWYCALSRLPSSLRVTNAARWRFSTMRLVNSDWPYQLVWY